MDRVCILMDSYQNPYAGTEGQVYLLAEELPKRGVEVELQVFRGSDYLTSEQFPVPIRVLNIGSILSFHAFWRLWQSALDLKRRGFRTIHIFFNDASVVAPPIFKLLGFRVFISRRDMGFWYTPSLLRILRQTQRFVDIAICNSRAVADLTARQEGFPKEKIAVIYNGFKTIALNNDDCSINELTSPWLPKSGPVIGIVANLRPIKRVCDLIRAFARVVQEYPDAQLHIIGGGDPLPLKGLAEELYVGKQVIFFGAQPEVHRFIKQFDIAVLCSESEGFSNSIIEYMCFGKPVVCSSTGGNPEIVDHGKNGLLFPVGDVEILAKNLLMLLSNGSLRNKLGRAGAEKVGRCFGLDAMVDAHLNLYSYKPGVVSKPKTIA